VGTSPIVDRTVSVDEDFDPVFRRLYPLAGRLAYRIVGDRGLAEDLAAEACARALARWGHLGRLAHREAWIMRVTSNLALDTVKRKPPTSRPTLPASDVGDTVALRLALAVALRALPRRQREVIVLRYLLDFPDHDIADTLGIKEGTVRTHARRGLGALRSRGILSLEDVTG
jgi:RNA polymerase sigma factor (sigma-70 family)